jgi:hypothetical protein
VTSATIRDSGGVARAGGVWQSPHAPVDPGGTGGVPTPVRLDLPAGISITLDSAALGPLVDLVADRLAARLEAAHAPPDPWLNRAQANEYIAGGQGRIDDLVAQGALRPARDGTKPLFRRSWLDSYVMGTALDGR